MGNPGPRFKGTRHNVGYEVVNRLCGACVWRPAKHYDHAVVTIRSRTVDLIKPTTYMNDSGLAVEAAMSRFGSRLQNVVVLVDDIHVAVGGLRIRRAGSEGGHNGLRSIVASLGSDEFARVRLGVGKVPPEVSQINYVLGQFETQELHRVTQMISWAADAVRTWCGAGVDVAMNSFNRR